MLKTSSFTSSTILNSLRNVMNKYKNDEDGIHTRHDNKKQNLLTFSAL